MDQQKDDDIGTGPAHRADSRNPDWKAYVPSGHGHTDEQIRADIHERLCGTTEPHPCAVMFTVSHAVVTLKSEAKSEAERRRMIELVKAVPSVADVRDEMQMTSGADVIQP